MSKILHLKTFFLDERFYWLCKLQSTKAMDDKKNNFSMNGIFEIKNYLEVWTKIGVLNQSNKLSFKHFLSLKHHLLKEIFIEKKQIEKKKTYSM